MKHWSRGTPIMTRNISKLSDEERSKSRYLESCMIFKNFSFMDDGKSKILIKKFDTPEEAQKRILRHGKLCKTTYRLIKVLKKIKRRNNEKNANNGSNGKQQQ